MYSKFRYMKVNSTETTIFKDKRNSQIIITFLYLSNEPNQRLVVIIVQGYKQKQHKK